MGLQEEVVIDMAPRIGSVVKLGHGTPCGFSLVTKFSKAWPFYHYGTIWRSCLPSARGSVVRIIRNKFYQNVKGVDWVYVKIPKRKGRYQFAVLYYKGSRRIA